MVKKERSKAYPSYNLQDCIDSAKKIKIGLGKGKHQRDSIAEAMGFSPKNGDVLRRISSMVQFGLLDKHVKENSYSLNSERIDILTHPNDQEELNSTLLELFFLPSLYADIMNKYEADGQIPKQLENILYRYHGITQSASADAAKVLIESGVYAGVIDENGRIKAVTDSKATGFTEDETELDNTHESCVEPKHTLSQQNSVTSSPVTTNNPVIINSQNQTFNFALTNGKLAQLIVPVSLVQKDILIIKKQIELLELQINED